MIKSNEKEFIRNWHQHKVALTRENTRIKQPIRDGEITYDQSDISHLASGLPSGIDNLVRSGSNFSAPHIGPISAKWTECVDDHVIYPKKIDKRKRRQKSRPIAICS